jgi:hypothetical protein
LVLADFCRQTAFSVMGVGQPSFMSDTDFHGSSSACEEQRLLILPECLAIYYGFGLS